MRNTKYVRRLYVDFQSSACSESSKVLSTWDETLRGNDTHEGFSIEGEFFSLKWNFIHDEEKENEFVVVAFSSMFNELKIS